MLPAKEVLKELRPDVKHKRSSTFYYNPPKHTIGSPSKLTPSEILALAHEIGHADIIQKHPKIYWPARIAAGAAGAAGATMSFLEKVPVKVSQSLLWSAAGAELLEEYLAWRAAKKYIDLAVKRKLITPDDAKKLKKVMGYTFGTYLTGTPAAIATLGFIHKAFRSKSTPGMVGAIMGALASMVGGGWATQKLWKKFQRMRREERRGKT